MSDKQFPILESSQLMAKGFPASVPWSAVEPHAKQAMRNHDQTLERLAQRGGLGWSELENILLDRPWDGRVFVLPKQRAEYEASERAAAERVMKLL